MKNIMRFLFIGAFVFVITPGHSEICTDFDDDFNVIEYECGTSVKDAINAQKQATVVKQAAEEKAKQDALRAEQLKAEQAAAAEKARIATERAEQERKEAEQKAKEQAEKEAERAKQKQLKEEQERKEAEQKAKEKAEKEAERAKQQQIKEEKKRKEEEQKAKERAEREHANEKRKAEIQAEKDKYWSRKWHPFVAAGFYLGSKDCEYSSYSEKNSAQTDFNNLDLQAGINYKPKKSDWEFGLRVGYFSADGQIIDKTSPVDLSVKFKQTHIDLTVGYEIFNHFNIFGGVGLERNKTITDMEELAPPFSSWQRTDNSWDLALFAGAEYWFWNNFGIYAEYKYGFVDFLGAGLKLRF